MKSAAFALTRSLVLALLFVTAATAQAPNSPPASGDLRVEGTIVDAETGQPLENAHIRGYCCGNTDVSVSSDTDGNFRLPLRRPARYTLGAWRDGYVTDRSLTVTECSPCTVTIRLHAHAKFSGRVVSADAKEPVAQVTVEAFPVAAASGAMTVISADRTMTDRNGEFTLANLTPGQYFFHFTPMTIRTTMLMVAGPADPRDSPTRQFVGQWWPGGDAYQNATPFTVMAGTDFRLPDIWLPAEARFQVSGRVLPDKCASGDAFTVAIGKHHGAAVEPLRNMVVECGSEFAFADLIPGSYRISLVPQGKVDADAREEVVVTDRDLRKDLTPAVHDR